MPVFLGFSFGSEGRESACNASRPLFDSWVGKIPWRRDGLPIPVFLGFPGGSDGKESASNSRDLDLISGLGKPPGAGNSYPLQFSGLENSRDKGAWQDAVHGVAKTEHEVVRLSNTHAHNVCNYLKFLC